VALSLERLFRKNGLPAPSSDGIPNDGGHYFTSGSRLTNWHGYARIDYGLEVKNYEIYELLMPLSRSYAELCFVDSELSLDSGEINAMYIARGRCSKWTLPEERSDAHWQRAARELGIPMMSISHSDLMPISSERSDAGLSQCETVIDIRQGFSCSGCGGFLGVAKPPPAGYSSSLPLRPPRFLRIDSPCNSSR
jgi:hypothetical protein